MRRAHEAAGVQPGPKSSITYETPDNWQPGQRVSSAGGISPGSSSIAYSASKAGLNHLTRCLAVAMAPEVAVNCVAPGLVEDTRMAKRLPDAVADGARRSAVLGRVGQAEDIAAQVLTFVTSTSISGQVVVVDGGMPAVMR